MTTTKQLRRWLISVARPVLKPLGASIVFRHVDQLAGLALLAISAGAVTKVAGNALGAPASETAWLPNTAAMLAVVLVTVSLVKGLARYLEHFFGHLVAFKALELLRVRLYQALVPQTPALMQRSTSGDLLVRATKDIDRIEVFFAHTFPPAVTAVTVPVIGVLTIGGIASWPVALVAAAGLVASLANAWLGSGANLAVSHRVAGLRGQISQHVTDSVQGMAEVTGYGHVTRRLDELAGLDAQVAAAQRSRSRFQAARNGLQVIAMGATTLVATIVAVGQGLGLVPTAVTIALIWRLFDSTAAVKDFMSSLDVSMAAAERVHRIVAAAPLITDPESSAQLPAGPLAVAWNQVSYSYPSEGIAREPAVKDVTIDVPAGTHCCLIGHSGCGKSTLLQLALRFDDPQSGRVLVGGVDVRRLELAQLRSRVALVSQSPFLFHGSIADNLRVASPEATDDQLHEVLRIAQLDEEVEAMPGGLDAPIGEQGQRLSGGQQQRLALARALLTPADVFLLDEFTSHLNRDLADRVREGLRAARPRVTIIESTHLLDAVRADQVVRLDAGRLVSA